MSTVAFAQLLPAFAQAYRDRPRPQKNSSTKPRRRQGGGRRSVLATLSDKLFFLLFYFRHYPTQETLAFLFGFSQGQAVLPDVPEPKPGVLY
ncbi:MAG: helix-turn-helix domain-containing protein [Gemmataceae bacterium]